MLRNYFKTALRNLVNNWTYSLTNIVGLSIGLAASIFILVFVMHELSYDKFHEKSDRIYRIAVEGSMGNNGFVMAVTAPPMSQAMVDEFPMIEQSVRLRESGDWLVRYGDKKFNEDYLFFADSTFFEVFSFPLLRGDPKTALARPNTLVMTQSASRRYFGEDNPVGKTLRVGSDTTVYTVTGLMEDIPENAHFHFDMLGSLNSLRSSQNPFWLTHNFYTYIVLDPGADPQRLEDQLDVLVDKYVGPQVQQALGISMEQFTREGNAIRYFMQPVTDIHLKSHLQYEVEANSDIQYVYIFSVIAILILILASINYINMATAKSTNRSVEVGMRKVVGSSRRALRFQFLLESFILVLVSLVVAVILVELLMPRFNNLVQLSLDIPWFDVWYVIPGMLVLALLVSFLAGAYPAFYLSSFSPISVMKGSVQQGIKSGRIRKILVTGQFVISIAILLATYTVYDQLSYMQEKDPGFQKENILVVRRSDGLRQSMEAFKQELKRDSRVEAVSNANTIPGRNFSNNGFFLPGSNETKMIHQAWVSYDYEQVFNFEMARGRFFSRDYPSDSTAIVINEAAVKDLGFGDEPLGKIILLPTGEAGQMTELRVIGVVKDFNFKSMHQRVEPAGFTLMRGNWEGFVVARLQGDNLSGAVRQVENTWQSFTSEYPFEYFFFNEDYNRLYASEARTSRILLVFSVLSVIIAGLGLLGLISFTTMKRQKEIGIRKSFGSTTPSVVMLLNREILLLIFYAILIAWPVAYFSLGRWLQDFSYRTQIDMPMFVIIPGLILVLALAIVSWQSFSAASRNPAHTLRYE
jgi:putative ABC transport system permease protein